jgi:hypothetical protein
VLDAPQRRKKGFARRGNLGCTYLLATAQNGNSTVCVQGSASCMASVGSALLCSRLAFFSADVSCKSILWLLPEPRDLSDLKLKVLDFLGFSAGFCCVECNWGAGCGGACWWAW